MFHVNLLKPDTTFWSKVMSDPKADAYVDGFAVHWYLDNWVDLPFVLNLVHDKYPSKFILYSEACNGEIPFLDPMLLT